MPAHDLPRKIKSDPEARLGGDPVSAVESAEDLIFLPGINAKSEVPHPDLREHFILQDGQHDPPSGHAVLYCIVQDIADCFPQPVGVMGTDCFFRK